jgi:hypothetical protein
LLENNDLGLSMQDKMKVLESNNLTETLKTILNGK